MINVYTGTPGSGKSLHAAERIYMRLKYGDPMVLNFPVNIPKKYIKRADVTVKDNSEMTPDFLFKYSAEYFQSHNFKEGAILLIIDEAQLLFNARDWGRKGMEKWCSIFQQHRKLGYDIIFICQSMHMLDKQIRSLAEYEIIHRKLSNFGLRGYFLSAVMLSPHMFVAVRVWSSLNEKVDSEFFRYSRKYAKLYNTLQTFETVPLLEEK